MVLRDCTFVEGDMLQVFQSTALDPRVLWCGGSDDDGEGTSGDDGDSGADLTSADEQEDDGGAEANSGPGDND